MPVLDIPNLKAIEEIREENPALVAEFNPDKNQETVDILLVNLMSTKEVTEKQFLRLLGHSPYLVDVTLVNMETHTSKNTPQEHLDTFYQGFSKIKNREFDGMIITGAPLEELDFYEVDFFNELTELLEWRRSHVASTLYVCWGAQAALHYFHHIERVQLDEKISGIFQHHAPDPAHPLTEGLEDNFSIPHSRLTTFNRQDFEFDPDLDIVVDSEDAGATILVNERSREIFITGHLEYDKETLELEYLRDKALGLPINIPENYYPDDNPTSEPVLSWREPAEILYTNWLNNYVPIKVKNY